MISDLWHASRRHQRQEGGKIGELETHEGGGQESVEALVSIAAQWGGACGDRGMMGEWMKG